MSLLSDISTDGAASRGGAPPAQHGPSGKPVLATRPGRGPARQARVDFRARRASRNLGTAPVSRAPQATSPRTPIQSLVPEANNGSEYDQEAHDGGYPTLAARDDWFAQFDTPISKGIFDVSRRGGVVSSDMSLILDDQLAQLENLMQLPFTTQDAAHLGQRCPKEDALAWVDHRVWVDNLDYSVTTAQQPQKLLRPEELRETLKPQGAPISTGKQHNATYRRLVYIADPGRASVRAIIQTATLGMGGSLRSLIQGFFARNTGSKCQILREPTDPWLILPTFQITHFTLFKGSRRDRDTLGRNPLRLTIPLSFLAKLSDNIPAEGRSESYMCQAVTSLAMTVWSKRRWDCFCLSDEYHLEFSRMSDYPSSDPIPRNEDLAAEQYPPGIQLVRTDITDPILEQEASVTHQDPRAYFLKSLQRALEIATEDTEELYNVYDQPVSTQNNSLLPPSAWNIGQLSHRVKIPSAEVLQAARDTQLTLTKISNSTTQQLKAAYTFLDEDLHFDRRSTTFHNPLFESLNNSRSGQMRHNYGSQILQTLRRLELVHERFLELGKSCHEVLSEYNRLVQVQHDLERRQHAHQALSVSISHFTVTAMAIPLALYSVPTEITQLPSSLPGFVGVTFAFIAPLNLPMMHFLFPQASQSIQQYFHSLYDAGKRWLVVRGPSDESAELEAVVERNTY